MSEGDDVSSQGVLPETMSLQYSQSDHSHNERSKPVPIETRLSENWKSRRSKFQSLDKLPELFADDNDRSSTNSDDHSDKISKLTNHNFVKIPDRKSALGNNHEEMTEFSYHSFLFL